MVITSALVTTFSTFLFGTLSDRIGERRKFISIGYIACGVFTIVFGLTEFLITGMENLKHSVQSIASLSARELEILTLATEGFKRDEIAERLYVSEGTVQTHLHNIYLKLEVSGRTAAIRRAQKLKIL